MYLREAIAYAFAMGHSSIALFDSSNIAAYDYDGNVESVFQTRRIQEMWHNEVEQRFKDCGVQMVGLQVWEDGAEVNTVKQNRNSSGFFAQAYIMHTEDVSGNPRNSLLLCMGKEDETHEEFQLELNDQLHELSKTITYFYVIAKIPL